MLILWVILTTCLYILVGIMSYLPAKVKCNTLPQYTSMKVAVLVSGPVRGSVETLYHYIVGPLQADVFVNAPSFPHQRAVKGIINSTSSGESNMGMMFKRMKDLESSYDFSQYDVVIRTRPDIIFSNYLRPNVLEAASQGYLMMFPKNCLKHSLSSTGLSYTDTFFLSSAKNMRLISTIYDTIDPSSHLLGEDVLTNFIRQSDMKVKVVYGYELLLDSHRLEKFNLIRFISRKVIDHWPS